MCRVIEEYTDLRKRFEKAVAEIRLMKRELRESHAQTDCLELSLINVRQDLNARQAAADSEIALMAARIQDLALKLCHAEKQVGCTVLLLMNRFYNKLELSFSQYDSYYMFKLTLYH